MLAVSKASDVRGSVFIAGYYGFDNAGDEAILGCMVEHLRALRPDLKITVASGNPDRTASQYGVRSVLWNDMGAVRGAVEECGLVLVGGGGLFHDYWGVDPDAFLTDRHWGPVYFAGPAILAMLHQKPLMIYAVGVGPLVSEHARSVTRSACDAANVVTVRDAGSRQLLKDLGVAGDIVVTADPAFAFQPPRHSGYAVRPGSAPVLGISLRPWAIGAYPEFWQREVALALDGFMEKHGGSVLFLPFQTHRGERENDIAVADAVRSQMQARDAARVIDSSPEALFGAIGQCDIVLGMRLHALVFAFLNRKPFVALNYDPKVSEFLRSAGLGPFSVDITAVDAKVLSALLDRAWVEQARFGDPLDELRGDLAGKARENACMAISLLEGSGTARMTPGSVNLLARSLKVHQTENQSLRRRIAELEAEKRQAALDREELSKLRRLLADTALGLASFRSRMAGDLKTYRSQRAWNVMLVVRKAYTLLTRESKPAFARWLLRLPYCGPGPLAPFELTFPDVAENIPAALLERAGAQPAIARQKKYDLIVLAIIDFDFRFQRPQQIAAQFARAGHRVFWISPTRFLNPAAAEPYQLMPLRENLWEVHLRGQQPDIYLGELTPDQITQLGGGLRDLCRDAAVSESAVIVQLPFWRQLALRSREELGCAVIYDCMDEWATFPNMGPFNISEERRLVDETDVLVVSGRTLLEKFQAEDRQPVLARNGVDFDFYSQPHTAAADVPAKRPVIGYFGAIADWMDLDLVRAAAAARPQYSFVMVGQVFRDDIAKIELPNVHLMGSKPYAEIPSYLETFDVCVIPFVLNEVTKATDPVKLYEYLARGKPVVSTAMAELAECADLIYIARDADEYVSLLDRAVAENDASLRERRIAYAAANTWSQRCRTIDAAIAKTFPLISIVVVTHNSAEFIGPCLDSITAETSYPNYEVIVVDNASTDDTVKVARSRMTDHPRIVLQESPTNIGFAAANNVGAGPAKGEYLVLLNSDTIVTSGWLGRLRRHFERNEALGLVCPVTNFAGNEAMIDTGYLSAEEMQRFAQNIAREHAGQLMNIEVAPLFCAMLRMQLWRELGGLDERFAIGMFEDDDFSLRVRNRGMRVAAAEDCFVHHFGQGSFAKLPGERYEQVFQANRKKFEEKWKTSWKAHRTRPDVKPAFERMRFQPAAFCEPPSEPNRHAHS